MIQIKKYDEFINEGLFTDVKDKILKLIKMPVHRKDKIEKLIPTPFCRQSTKFSCGAVAVQIISEYYGMDFHETVWYPETSFSDGHYVVAIGFSKNRIYFSDPSLYKLAYLENDEFVRRWHDIEGRKKFYQFGLAVFGKEPKFNEEPEKIM